jgi:hypothetical protein
MTIRFDGFTVQGYKAFSREARVDLAPLTIVLGRNNSGKSSLCFAPLFLSNALRRDADTPFPLEYCGIDFGDNLLEICFRRQLSGLKGQLLLGGAEISRVGIAGVALAERNYLQVVTELEVDHPTELISRTGEISWAEARESLAHYPELAELSQRVGVLLAQRDAPERRYRSPGIRPITVGSKGESASQLLAYAKTEGADEVLKDVNDWFRLLGVRLDIAAQDGGFSVVTRGPSGETANLVDTGSGIAQILPLVVALKALPEDQLPLLYVIEQPELHLHPYAHAHVAELLIESVAKNRSTKFLVETHSDALILRLRREVAARRLVPADVRLYFVDESDGGSCVKAIQLNERGVPDWWPEGVFAESQTEYRRFRRELAKRDQVS